MYTNIIARVPGKDFDKGITKSNLGYPDYEKALEQHKKYINKIESLGIKALVLPPLEGYPDACFVEDTAIVTKEFAIITNPGAQQRKGEVDSIANSLKDFMEIIRISDPSAIIDGGDVLLVGDKFFIGISGRTNIAGFRAIESILGVFNKYTFQAVEIRSGLHLKSNVTMIGDNSVIITESLKNHPAFTGIDKVVINDEDSYVANTLLINGTLLMSDGYPVVKEACEKFGCKIELLEISEFKKMDGALTCLSIRF